MKELKSSVHKTFAILEQFTSQKQEWGVTELAEAVGSNKSTVYRFLSDLSKIDILYKHPDTEKYSLGIKLFEIGSRVALQSAFVEKTHPELIKVANRITETVHIAILKSHRVFYVDKVESPQGLRISSQIGSYNPAYATALGKVLLAHLTPESRQVAMEAIFRSMPLKSFTSNTITKERSLIKALNNIKEQGFSIDREEFEQGLICVAVPIYNQHGVVVASLSASGPANRFEERNLAQYVSILQGGAEAIKNKIGYFKP